MTYEELKENYELARDAYRVALQGQSVSKGQRSHTSQELANLKADYLEWGQKLERFSETGKSGGVDPLYAKFN